MASLKENPPLSEKEHEELRLSFTAVTGAQPTVALRYLQQKNWNIEEALNSFYDAPSSPSNTQDGSHSNSSQSVNSSRHSTSTSGTTAATDSLPPSPGFRLITWNIDGLDPRNIKERTLAACTILKQYKPDIVYLQEVIFPTFLMISSELDNYKAIPATGDGYFTLILLRKSTVTYLSSKVEAFEESEMTRALQKAECKCAGIDLCLMTSHLESTADGKEERCNQFSRSLYRMKTATGEQTVLFGGDTNLRDKEVTKVGLPSYIRDVWEMCGSPEVAKFTWDLTKNNNLNWSFPNRPKLRFDRLYLRHAKTSPRVVPQDFGLIGTERLEGCGRFPSDHWGIVCDFKVTPLPT
ncbi:tyrosyl-DNA phosphodiesterase 2-like [Asterias amurensis]|uniref:tyrosyl-DNA phosphodiesterase 2-like n=1 Tax=Asterias amurensis TaxID=7602 RepID=UPI003AB32AE3